MTTAERMRHGAASRPSITDLQFARFLEATEQLAGHLSTEFERLFPIVVKAPSAMRLILESHGDESPGR